MIKSSIFIPIMLLFIDIIIQYFGKSNLNDKFWLSNSLGAIFGNILYQNKLFKNFLLFSPLNLIIKNNSIMYSIIKYLNIFLFQNIFYIIIYNDYSLITHHNMIKIFLYVILYTSFDHIGNKLITKNGKKKEIMIGLTKIIGAMIIIELLYKKKLDKKDFISIIKIILAFSIYYIVKNDDEKQKSK